MKKVTMLLSLLIVIINTAATQTTTLAYSAARTYRTDLKERTDEKMDKARFVGGDMALQQYIAQNLRYPTLAEENAIEGMVLVQFQVTATGVLKDIKILESLGFGCEEEVTRLLQQMPNWEPARRGGHPRATNVLLPINFALH